MDQPLPLNIHRAHAAPRCGARTRAGTPCRAPAIAGRRRCRMHGGRSPGAPRGKANPAYRNGLHTGEQLGLQRDVSAVLAFCRWTTNLALADSARRRAREDGAAAAAKKRGQPHAQGTNPMHKAAAPADGPARRYPTPRASGAGAPPPAPVHGVVGSSPTAPAVHGLGDVPPPRRLAAAELARLSALGNGAAAAKNAGQPRAQGTNPMHKDRSSRRG
jgi:hypothetical protein